ncbi:MAG: transketolase [bacterium]|nr:transketolase [bacterium]
MVDNGDLRLMAKLIRRLILEMTYRGKEGHIGTDYSCVDILTALYFCDILRVDPQNPTWQERDRFVMSKGHGAASLYATLAVKGFFPEELLNAFCQEGSSLSAHVTFDCLPGVESSAGSGGHGLPMAVGMALAAKHDNRNSKIYVLVGDGECQEGSIWEALLFAGHHQLDNLTLIIDHNNLQTAEKVSEVVGLEPLRGKMESFGWQAQNINGHDIDQIRNALLPGEPQSKHGPSTPRVIIAKTIKGRGVSFMENNPIWHGRCPNEEEYRQAWEELS